MQNKERAPFSQLIIYATGQFGWSLAAYGAATLLVYFYLPPEEIGKSPIFPPFFYQGLFFGVVTLIGAISFGSRLFDAITDPFIAITSDRQTAKGGKRLRLMRWAVLPFAVLSFLIFLPPMEGDSIWNAVWLVFTIFLFYFFMTLYVVPYNALISELGHHPDDRMRISTYISIAWALGFVLGGMVYGIQGFLTNYLSAVMAFQVTMGGFAVIALLAMLCPILFLKEEQYAVQSAEVSPSLRQSLAAIWQNSNFRFFIFSDLFYWVALTFIQQGVGYYVTAIFGLPVAYSTLFLGLSFVGSFLLYLPVNVLVRRMGKGSVLRWAFMIFALVFLITALIPMLRLSPELFFYVLAVLSAFPLAAFGIIPNALIADFIHEEEKETGQSQAGMYYAVRNFMMKLGVTIASLIFPSLLILGRNAEDSLGVEVSAWAAAGFCVLGWVIFNKVKNVSNTSSST